jgi:hypothetical protein
VILKWDWDGRAIDCYPQFWDFAQHVGFTLRLSRPYWAQTKGMVGFGQPMVNAMLMADAIGDMAKGILIGLAVGELDAIIGQHGVKLVGHGGDQVA